MHFDENIVRWTLGLCLDIVVAIFALRSGLFKRLPVFTCYLFVVAACDFASTLCRVIFPVRSFPVFYEYWGGQAIMMGMRAAVVADIFGWSGAVFACECGVCGGWAATFDDRFYYIAAAGVGVGDCRDAGVRFRVCKIL